MDWNLVTLGISHSSSHSSSIHHDVFLFFWNFPYITATVFNSVAFFTSANVTIDVKSSSFIFLKITRFLKFTHSACSLLFCKQLRNLAVLPPTHSSGIHHTINHSLFGIYTFTTMTLVSRMHWDLFALEPTNSARFICWWFAARTLFYFVLTFNQCWSQEELQWGGCLINLEWWCQVENVVVIFI